MLYMVLSLVLLIPPSNIPHYGHSPFKYVWAPAYNQLMVRLYESLKGCHRTVRNIIDGSVLSIEGLILENWNSLVANVGYTILFLYAI